MRDPLARPAPPPRPSGSVKGKEPCEFRQDSILSTLQSTKGKCPVCGEHFAGVVTASPNRVYSRDLHEHACAQCACSSLLGRVHALR